MITTPTATCSCDSIPRSARPCGGAGLAAKSCPTLATPWTVACQAPLSLGFFWQEYWSGLSIDA